MAASGASLRVKDEERKDSLKSGVQLLNGEEILEFSPVRIFADKKGKSCRIICVEQNWNKGAIIIAMSPSDSK